MIDDNKKNVPEEYPSQFETTFNSSDLKSHAVKGGVATVTSQAAKLLLQTVTTAILARILMPKDFGLVAMVLVFSNYALIFKDLGLSSATIQREKITHLQVNAMFWVNVGFSASIAMAVAMLSFFIAKLYSQPELVLITVAIAVTFLIEGLGSQHLSLLKRQLRFKSVVLIDVSSVFLGVLVALLFAYLGYGYWALVWQIVSQVTFSTIFIWLTSGWRPSAPKWDESLPEMLGFGWRITAFNSLTYAVRNVDNLLIGIFIGPAALGIYTKSYNLLMLPVRQVSNPLASVAMPALSKLQSDREKFRGFFLSICSVATIVSVPLVGYSFVDADILVHILLGDNWHAAIDVFRYLAPACMAGAISFIPSVLCVSLGKPKIQLRWALLTTPLIVFGFIAGIKLGGLNGVALSFSLTYPFSLLIFFYMVCKDSPVSVNDVFKSIVLPICSGIVAVLALIFFKKSIQLGLTVYLLPFVDFLVYIFIFISFMMIFMKGRQDLKRILNLKQSLK